MKVLFVYSGNSQIFRIPTFIKSQGESLKNFGINVEYFSIVGKGFSGYFHSIFKLRAYIKKNHFDIIHAHYSLSGWVAFLAKKDQKLIISLMGDDAYGSFDNNGKRKISSIYLILSTLLIQPFASFIITKSINIDKKVYLKYKASIVPNGVNLNDFYILSKKDARNQLNLSQSAKIALFLGNPNEKRKNFELAQAAVNRYGNALYLLSPYPISHELIHKYLCAADLLVFTSTAEGSPNVIKEAMACNCPIVATNVGDITWVLGNTPGCFISSFDIDVLCNKLRNALEFASAYGKTSGRQRLLELGLDTESVAQKLISIYRKVLV